MAIWIIFIAVMIMSWLVSNKLKRKFKKYSKIPVGRGMTGRDIVEKMLHDHGIHDVSIGSVGGQLTDHYNPARKSINLSREVYSGSSIASAAVAAHECGHAVQHAKAYTWLGLRSKLVPAVSFASKWVHWVLIAGIILIESMPWLLLAGIVLFALITIFSLITLPVEINASKRALAWLSDSGITVYGTHEKAEDALRWASYTYVIAALGSIAALLYYVLIFIGLDN
ncbi:MAG: zinc metallopeptidase [Bacteroidales bacterium]|nr:zinc metallopeptidase [Bacteroidales bacterium]